MTGNAWDRAAREDSIRRLVTQGVGNTEIGRRLGMKPNTVYSVRKRLGLPTTQRPVATKQESTTCDLCRRWVVTLGTRRGDLHALAVRASKAKYGPSETQKASIAQIKSDIAEIQDRIESHNCGA